MATPSTRPDAIDNGDEVLVSGRSRHRDWDGYTMLVTVLAFLLLAFLVWVFAVEHGVAAPMAVQGKLVPQAAYFPAGFVTQGREIYPPPPTF